MSPIVLYLIGIGVGMLLGVVILEVGELRERDRREDLDAEWRALDGARDITGRL